MTRLVLRGAKEIGEVIGRGRNEVLRLIKEEDLPAWKETPSSPWQALPEDLREWLRKRRARYLSATQNPVNRS
jgi:hypothetical protein